MIPSPAIARERLSIRWVHFGNGHFFRAHQIYFNDKAVQKNGSGFGCSAINLRSPEKSLALKQQNNLFTIATEKSREVMGSLLESLSLQEDEKLCRERLSSKETFLITLTITEKGYQENEPAIRLLAEILTARFKSHGEGLLCLSCDNLQKNGKILKDVVFKRLSPPVLAWAQEKCFFPSTMVDRIVPHFSPKDLQDKQIGWGYQDPSAIFTEEFAQWIIEDKIGPHRLGWESAGVQFVTDVTPYEKIKLQVLNASHSWLAYRGLLKGYEVVADCMKDQDLIRELSDMIDHEIAPHLILPSGFHLNQYKDQMFLRFKHPTMRHRLSQIAMDGTVKIPQRWLPSLSSKSSLLLKGLAAWFKYIQTQSFQDPQREKLEAMRGNPIFSVLKEFKLLPPDLQEDDQIKLRLESEWSRL